MSWWVLVFGLESLEKCSKQHSKMFLQNDYKDQERYVLFDAAVGNSPLLERISISESIYAPSPNGHLRPIFAAHPLTRLAAHPFNTARYTPLNTARC
jgi:hypothetical protein